MAFYDDMKTLASDLIEEFGKDITVRQERSDTDKTNPWEGKTADVQTYTTVAVFDKVKAKDVDGTLVKKDDVIAYIPSEDEDFEIEIKDFIIDGSTTYNIIDVEKIEPSPTNIMYILLLRK